MQIQICLGADTIVGFFYFKPKDNLWVRRICQGEIEYCRTVDQKLDFTLQFTIYSTSSELYYTVCL
jgi:hypothetical protein